MQCPYIVCTSFVVVRVYDFRGQLGTTELMTWLPAAMVARDVGPCKIDLNKFKLGRFLA